MLNLLRWNGVEIDVNLSFYRFGTQQIHEMGVQVVYRVACEPKSHTFRKLINGFSAGLCARDVNAMHPKVAECLWIRRI